jgi:hypothetical protein
VSIDRIGPCDHCGVNVRYEDPGGIPFFVLCAKCEAEVETYPHPSPCWKCEEAGVPDHLVDKDFVARRIGPV